MKVIHTSDWHLGHSLHGFSREYEHQCFLNWLPKVIIKEAVDVLIISGNVFHSTTPSPRAQQMYYGFLAALKACQPHITVIIIAGSHDNPSLLKSSAQLLNTLNIQVISHVPFINEEKLILNTEKLIIPLRDKNGSVSGWCGALPFIHPDNLLNLLPADTECNSANINYKQAMESVCLQLSEAVMQKSTVKQAAIITSCGMIAEKTCPEDNETGCNQHLLPVDILSRHTDYVALGYLHKAQKTGYNHVQYAGSPVALAFNETDYTNQVRLITFSGKTIKSNIALPVPEAVRMLKLPPHGSASLAEIETLAENLPERKNSGPLPQDTPLLEVKVLLNQPEPQLRQLISHMLSNKSIRLARISVHYTQKKNKAATDKAIPKMAPRLNPENVFLEIWHREFDKGPDAKTLKYFRNLLGTVNLEQDSAGDGS